MAPRKTTGRSGPSPPAPLFKLSLEGTRRRIDSRKAAVAPISPISTGLPSARSAVTVRCEWCEKKNPQLSKTHTRFFLSSLRAKQKYVPPQPSGGTGASKTATIKSAMPPSGKETVTAIEEPTPHSTSPSSETPCWPSSHSKNGLPLARFFDLHRRRPAVAPPSPRRRPAVALHLILNTPPQL